MCLTILGHYALKGQRGFKLDAHQPTALLIVRDVFYLHFQTFYPFSEKKKLKSILEHSVSVFHEYT